MATRSMIGKDYGGEIKAIYCHWDGYIQGVGQTLKEFYTDESKIDDLIKLGSISSLGKNLTLQNGERLNKTLTDAHGFNPTEILYDESENVVKLKNKDNIVTISMFDVPMIGIDLRHIYGELTTEMEAYVKEVQNIFHEVTVAYHRDRGEGLNISIFRDEKEYIGDDNWAEYLYLYKNGEWYVYDTYSNEAKFKKI